MAIKCVLFVLCYHLLLGGAVSEFTPTVFPAKILSSSQCGQQNPLHDEQVIEVLRKIQQRLPSHPANNTSCMDIHNADPSAPSGYYSIFATNGSAVQVYCDMEGTNCGGKGGWTRVAYVNLTQPGATCPQGLTQNVFPGLTLCGRSGPGCVGTVFSTLGLNYSRVCGQLQGYQWGSPDAFDIYNYDSSRTIDDGYVDGVSITHGSAPQKHIWTYAGGVQLGTGNIACPCNTGSNEQVPPYVGSDYYCETGVNQGSWAKQLYPNDLLWDGQQCVGVEAPCCTHPNMPWFLKALNETTIEDIELRMCGSFDTNNKDTPLQVIELFVY